MDRDFLKHRKPASSKEMKDFTDDFTKKFNVYINENLTKFLTNPSSFLSSFSHRISKYDLILLCKLENRVDIAQKLYPVEEGKMIPNFFTLNIQQVQSTEKKGFFKIMIQVIEKICEAKQINVLISQITNEDFAKMLEKNAYKVLKEGININAIKIYQTFFGKDIKKRPREEDDENKVADGRQKKSRKKKKSPKKTKSRKKRSPSFRSLLKKK